MRRMSIVPGLLLVLFVLGLIRHWEQLPVAAWLSYTFPKRATLGGDVQKVTFNGAQSGHQAYFIYLPQDYETGERPYNVLYHLHRAFSRESWTRQECFLRRTGSSEKLSWQGPSNL